MRLVFFFFFFSIYSAFHQEKNKQKQFKVSFITVAESFIIGMSLKWKRHSQYCKLVQIHETNCKFSPPLQITAEQVGDWEKNLLDIIKTR